MDIKKKIKQCGFTISEVAAKMPAQDGSFGITQSGLSKIISGNPTITRLESIAEILGISVAELISDDESGNELRCPHCGKPVHIKVD